MEDSTPSMEKVMKVLRTMTNTEMDVWQTPFDEIHRKGVFRLIHYHPKVGKPYPTPTLIVYAFINRPYILDLQPDKSVVRRFLESGLDVYMIDWGYPKKADRYITIEDYVDYIDIAVGIVSRRAGVSKVTLHGYCLGGTLSVIYSTLYPEKVKNLLIQATPINFDIAPNISIWAKSLDVDKVVDTLGNALGEFLNTAFLLADPIRLTFGKYANLVKNIDDVSLLKNFLRMEKWIFDSPDVPGETFRQYIKEWYQKNLLVKNEFVLAGRKVDLKNINMPILALIGEYDHIAPPESTKPLLDIISSTDKKAISFPTGHVGLSISSRVHEKLWPAVCDWLRERSG